MIASVFVQVTNSLFVHLTTKTRNAILPLYVFERNDSLWQAE
jgi:hypothetical protein